MADVNPHVRDARLLLGIGWSALERGRDRPRLVEAVLFLALGLDRVLKGILHDVNPLYVYEVQDFANTLPAHYPDRVIEGSKGSKELSKAPNSDTCSTRKAAERARVVCPEVQSHFGVILSLTKLRDSICHQDLAPVSDEELEKATSDAYVALMDLLPRVGLSIEVLFDESESARDAQRKAELAPQHLQDRLVRHRHRYEMLAQQPEHMKAAEIRTTFGLAELGALPADCPACLCKAVIETEIDYDWMDHEAVPQGIIVKSLKCYFCDLVVTDSSEMDLLNLYDQV